MSKNIGISVFDVADYFLAKVDEEEGDSISNMKLQKLVYYAQGCYIALYNNTLFPEKILAWDHGPVVQELWKKYTTCGNGSIPKPDNIDLSKIPEEIRNFLDDVWNVYGQYSAWGLRCLTHSEPPWMNTPKNEEISFDKLKEFFKYQVTQ